MAEFQTEEQFVLQEDKDTQRGREGQMSTRLACILGGMKGKLENIGCKRKRTNPPKA